MKLLSFPEVCQRLSICDKTGRKFKDQLPNPVRVGSRTMWPEDAIAGFIARGGCHPTERTAA